jgi:hypothetical protein
VPEIFQRQNSFSQADTGGQYTQLEHIIPHPWNFLFIFNPNGFIIR